jgi:hypothetical protein
VVALFAVAGASQIVAGFDGYPTALQLAMTILHTLVAGGAAGWMAIPVREARSRESSGAVLVRLEKKAGQPAIYGRSTTWFLTPLAA